MMRRSMSQVSLHELIASGSVNTALPLVMSTYSWYDIKHNVQIYFMTYINDMITRHSDSANSKVLPNFSL